MATQNPFDLLGDDDTEDPSLLLAAQQQKLPVQTKKAPAPAPQLQQSKPAAKLPSKPVPPAQAVREAKGEGGRGGGRGRGYGRGRGGNGSVVNRELAGNGNTFGNREFSSGQASGEEADPGKSNERRGGYGGLRGSFRGPRRGGFSNGEMGDGERHRRPFDRRSGTGRGNEIKREGAGRGNWGTQSDELLQAEEVVNEDEKTPNAEKLPSGEEETTVATKETPATETEKEPENKEMTLEEYEKVLEEKRKALQALKTEERKVDAEVFASMQQLANKKNNDDVFIKLSSDRDKKREAAEKEERAKKAVSINEFLKPADGERYYSGGRGRGRGRGGRGYGGGNSMNNVEAPAIEDPGQFPSLGGK